MQMTLQNCYSEVNAQYLNFQIHLHNFVCNFALHKLCLPLHVFKSQSHSSSILSSHILSSIFYFQRGSSVQFIKHMKHNVDFLNACCETGCIFFLNSSC